MTETIQFLKLSEIVPNPYQPRSVFNQEKLLELSESIAENGILQPIIVRKSALIGYELLAGERRFQASKLAGLLEIPAIVRVYSDEKMMTLSILENLQRENLNPVEEAKSLALLADKLGMTHEEIGKSLGKSRSYVSNLIRILNLPERILSWVEAGDLSLAHGRTLLAEPSKIKQKNLAERVLAQHLSVRELESLIYHKEKTTRQQSSHEIRTDKAVSTDIFTDELEIMLKRALGNTVKIKSNKQHKGVLSLSFDSLDELENLVEKLKK
jgi:ParB family chromosome partitioning protein